MSAAASAILAAFFTTASLLWVYLYLFAKERRGYLGFWALSWGVMAVRYGFAIAADYAQVSDEAVSWLSIAAHLSALLSAAFLLWGTAWWAQRSVSLWWVALVVLVAAWIMVSTRLEFAFLWISLPTFWFLALLMVWTGVVALRLRGGSGPEVRVAAVALILWGLHRANFPFLGTVEWFRPWGYLLSAAFGMLTSTAMLLAYFQRNYVKLLHAREAAKALNRELERHVEARTRQLEKEKKRAEKAARAKSDFLAKMSHEIRTPISGVIGMTELALATDLTPDQRRYLELALENAETLLELLENLLEYSKIEAGKVTVKSSELRLADIVRQVSESLGSQAASKGVSMEPEIGSDVPDLVLGDRVLVKEILLNLVGNAVKFTDEGHVRIHVGTESIVDGVASIHLQVMDTGVGIPQDRQREIFDSFAQVDSSSTRRFHGVGLGLAIAAELVGLMRGRIWVESEVGKGSTFHVLLPLPVPGAGDIGRSEPPRIAAARRDDTRTDRPLRVLLVEDTETNRLLARALLANLGHEVVLTGTGAEALERLEREGFDLVLTDLRLPDMDGLAVTREIRARERARNDDARTKVIAVTAHGLPGDREHCLAAGVDDYLVKPLRRPQLERALRDLFGDAALNDGKVAGSDLPRGAPAQVQEDESWLADALARLRGDKDLLRELALLFTKEAPDLLDAIRRSIEKNDSRTVEFSAHRLVGSASSFDAGQVSELALELETRASRGQLGKEAMVVHGKLEEETLRLIALLQDILDTPGELRPRGAS